MDEAQAWEATHLVLVTSSALTCCLALNFFDPLFGWGPTLPIGIHGLPSEKFCTTYYIPY